MDVIFKNWALVMGSASICIYRVGRNVFQHKLHWASQIKIFSQLNLHNSSAYEFNRKSDSVLLSISKCQIERECDLHNRLFRKYLVVQHRIRWCRDVMKIRPTLTTDNIIILLTFVPAGEKWNHRACLFVQQTTYFLV